MEHTTPKINCPKCGKPMYEDPMFACGAVTLISGTGKELVDGGMATETRMLCDDCPHVEFVQVGTLPGMVLGE